MRSFHMRVWTGLIVAVLLGACGAGSTSAPSGATSSAKGTATGGTAGAAATTGAAASAPAATGAGAGTPIGIAVAQTSNVSLFGQEQVIGAKIAEKYLNSRGGPQIKLVFQDTGGKEDGTISAFQTLINQQKVAGIVGPTLSQQAFAADPEAVRAKVPVVGPSNTAKGIPQIGPYVSRVSAPVDAVAPTAVKAAFKLNPNIKKVAVLFAQNDAFSKSETGVFQQIITGTAGLTMLPVQTFQTTDTDFTTQASSVSNAKPDLVIISGLAQDGGNLVRQLRDLGYTGLIIGGNGFNTPNIFPVCKAKCDGILVAQAYSDQLDSPVNNAFKEAYQNEQKKSPSQFSAQAFAAVQVFAEALAALDKGSKVSGMSLDDLRTKLNDQLRKGKYETPLGPISFTPEGEVVQSQFFVSQIKMNADGTTGSFSLLK
ncbi:MAG: ABC transporter substrate-binding protein [Herpetosiphon sp.]